MKHVPKHTQKNYNIARLETPISWTFLDAKAQFAQIYQNGLPLCYPLNSNFIFFFYWLEDKPGLEENKIKLNTKLTS